MGCFSAKACLSLERERLTLKSTADVCMLGRVFYIECSFTGGKRTEGKNICALASSLLPSFQ